MITAEEQKTKRQLISAVTFQYSAPLQRLKTHSLCQVFLKLLFLHPANEHVPLQVLKHEYREATKGGHISEYDAGQVLQRLCSDDKVEKRLDGSASFRLIDRVRAELEQIESEAERELNRVLEAFFSNGITQAAVYREGLLSIVSQVAATMGEESASYLLRRRTTIPYDPGLLNKWIIDIAAVDPRIDPVLLRAGVVDFFRSSDSFVQNLLWQITEAYFVTRMLGMDSAGNSLSREVFRKAEFVLDTNVILALLIEADEEHELALTTIKAIRTLNLPLIVAMGTLDETKNVIDRDLVRLETAVMNGQVGLLSRSDSPILREYARRRAAGVEELRSELMAFETTLVQKFAVELRGFRRPVETSEYGQLVEELRVRYQRGNPNRRLKSESVAQHDADLLLMVQERRDSTQKETWLLTLDTSLPSAVPDGSSHVSLALSPRTVIQWLAPVVNHSVLKDEFPKVFAEMVRGRFLPRTQFLTDGDLSVLVHFQEVINQLPEDDVERAVTHFMAETTRAVLTEAEGILAFSGIIQSVVSEPNSRYQSDLQSQKLQKEAIQEELTEITQKANELANRRSNEQKAAELALQAERDRVEQREQELLRLLCREGILRFWVFWGVIGIAALLVFFFGLNLPFLDRLSTLQYISIEVGLFTVVGVVIAKVALPSAVGRGNIPHMGPNYRKVIGE